ncbi:MAG: hypothetical protein Q4G68_00975 [Planctomycetia bacterium]|nr:hypothetical protein [Planctomycetia bacterium]
MKLKIYSFLFIAAILCFAQMPLSSALAIDAEYQQTLMRTTDESVLIDALAKEGESDDDVFAKSLACKRLAIIGTDAAVPALAAMLPSEKLNVYARYALEEIPGEAPNAALQKAAKELTGLTAVGAIDSIGVRRDASALPLFRELLGAAPGNDVRKAIYLAAGNIANDESAALLLEAVAGEASDDLVVRMGLGDAVLACADRFEKAGNSEKSAELFESLVCDKFPVCVQKAGSYRALLARGGVSVDKILEKLQGEKYCCFSAALKTLREFSDEDAATVVPAVIAIVPNLPVDRKALVLRALGDRKDDATRQAMLPLLIENLNNESVEVQLAAAKALANVGKYDVEAAIKGARAEKFQADQAVVDALVAAAVAMPGDAVDNAMLEIVNGVTAEELSQDAADSTGFAAVLKIIEERRTSAAAPALVKIANTPNVKPELRNGALDALSEIVSFDNLSLFVDALENESDDARIDWLLRAACTRLPREECAAEIVKIFEASDLAKKMKLFGLLKQIGGPTALACVEKACWNGETSDPASATLGQWNSPDDAKAVAEACLKLAKESKENKYRVRGIRSYIRIPRQFNLPTAERLAMCQTAFETAVRPEDKSLVFDIFPRIVEVSSAQAAMSYAGQAEYAEKAFEATVIVAEKLNLGKPDFDWKGANPEGASAENIAKADAIRTITGLMKEVLGKTTNDDLKGRAQKVIDRY